MKNLDYVFGLEEPERNAMLVRKFFATPGNCTTAVFALGNWLASERVSEPVEVTDDI